MSGRRGVEIDPKVARWLADISEAINSVGVCKTEYGVYELGDIPVLFDGETETGFAIVGSEFGEHHVPATWEHDGGVTAS